MKNKFLLTLLVMTGMMNLVLAQSSEKITLQNLPEDTSLAVPLSAQQVNVTLPASGGTYINTTSTVLPFFGYSISGIAKAYFMYNGNTNQIEYHQSSDATADFYIEGNSKAVFNTAFVGIGTSAPPTAYTGFAMKSSVNGWYGMYVDAGTTGLPFYGYALNGVARAYTQFNSASSQFEYHQSSDVTPDFYINGNTKAVFNTAFLGIGTGSPTTAFTGLAMKSSANSWYGMYIDAGATGSPFYGYALNGTAVAYTQYNGTTNQLEYYHSNPSIPDFTMSSTNVAYPATTFFGIGTTTPTTGFTGFALKSSANTWFGTYVDAGATGLPFYGYALNGVARAYTQFNSASSQFEYHQTSDGTPDFYINGNSKAVFNTAFVGIGTGSPTTGFTGFTMKSAANTWYGMYIDAGATGSPFYGYALNGTAVAYTQYNGTTNQLEYYHSNGGSPDFTMSSTNVAYPVTTFMGIGTSTPTTAFTGFALKSSANTWFGTYVDAGATGQPFYGYALNGVAKAYTSFNSASSQYEYHQTSDGTPDFYINGTTKAVFNTAFLGINTGIPTTGIYTGFAMKSSANTWYGMYIDAGATGMPFYGYALNGVAKVYTQLNGTNNNWELVYNSTVISVSSTSNVGIGTTTPAQKLDVNGTIHASNLNGGATSLSTDASGNIIRTPSDARLKCRVASIDNPLEKVMQLHGVSYNFIDSDRFGSDRQMGFLAQDLEKVIPETVSSGGEYKSVNYQEITALLAEAIKEQQKIINQLSERIETLEESKK